MIDLNILIPRNSSLQLLAGLNINDRGEILGVGVPPGVPPNTDLFGHQFLLIPCDRDHSDAEGCQDDGEGIVVATQRSSAPITRPAASTEGRLTPGMLAALRAQLVRRYHVPGHGAPSF
jgi:hypothetical protein